MGVGRGHRATQEDRDGLEKQAAALGVVLDVDAVLKTDDLPPAVQGVWAEHWSAVQVFQRVAATQWVMVMGMGAAVVTGLNHASVQIHMDALGIPPSERSNVWEQLAVMEARGTEIKNDQLRKAFKK